MSCIRSSSMEDTPNSVLAIADSITTTKEMVRNCKEEAIASWMEEVGDERWTSAVWMFILMSLTCCEKCLLILCASSLFFYRHIQSPWQCVGDEQEMSSVTTATFPLNCSLWLIRGVSEHCSTIFLWMVTGTGVQFNWSVHAQLIKQFYWIHWHHSKEQHGTHIEL